jgi:CRISPR/Cas system-associated exonuclease Cas4 (RecB family)
MTGKPSPSHLVQFLIYLKLTDSDEGFLLYENKDTQEVMVIPVIMTEDNIEYTKYLFDWMTKVYESFEKSELPTRPWTRKNARVCSGCPVREACLEKFDEGVVSIDVLEVMKP